MSSFGLKLTTLSAVLLLLAGTAVTVDAKDNESATTRVVPLSEVEAPTEATLPDVVDTIDANDSPMAVDKADCVVGCYQKWAVCRQSCYPGPDPACVADCNYERRQCIILCGDLF